MFSAQFEADESGQAGLALTLLPLSITDRSCRRAAQRGALQQWLDGVRGCSLFDRTLLTAEILTAKTILKSTNF